MDLRGRWTVLAIHDWRQRSPRFGVLRLKHRWYIITCLQAEVSRLVCYNFLPLGYLSEICLKFTIQDKTFECILNLLLQVFPTVGVEIILSLRNSDILGALQNYHLEDDEFLNIPAALPKPCQIQMQWLHKPLPHLTPHCIILTRRNDLKVATPGIKDYVSFDSSV